jgi:hypothetical protein
MNKFSQIVTESNSSNFVLSNDEMTSYKNFINELLNQNYPENIINISTESKPVLVYKAYNYEKSKMPGREYSVLGKVNTNKRLITKIWEKFNIQDFRHLKNLVRKLSKDLFDENGKFFKSNPTGFSVWDTIRETEISGETNEDFVCGFIKELYGESSNPIREVTSSYNDMILGIDITFKVDGIEKTCQVKPLKFDNFKERGVVIIESSGVLKNYKTDFIAFVNPKRAFRQKCLFFKNDGAIYDPENQTITLPYQSLVNKKYNIDNVNKES